MQSPCCSRCRAHLCTVPPLPRPHLAHPPLPPCRRSQPFQLLSLFPRAYLLPRFLDAQRCQHVIDMATKRLAPSGARRGSHS